MSGLIRGRGLDRPEGTAEKNRRRPLRTRMMATVAVAILAGSAGSTVVAAPAKAAIEDCFNYPGTICMAEHFDWGGRIWRQYPDQVSGCRALSRDNFNNKATDLVNNTSGHVVMYLYDNANCTGASISLGSQQVRSLRRDPFDNKASAIRVVQA